MKNNELISVIVPVYNVSVYLKKCLESIINQKDVNLEIILVNDGSTDDSGSICDEYAKKDSRINVIHKKNGGLSSARNAGLDIASGSYISFVDSDDWIECDMMKKLLECQIRNDGDITICGFERAEDDNFVIKNDESFSEELYTNIEALRNLYKEDFESEMIVSWNKLYRRELFDDIRFPDGKIHEDEFTTYKLFYKSSKIIFLNQKLYYYRMTPDSIMNSTYNKKRLAIVQALNERVKFAKSINDKEFYIGTLRKCCYESIDAFVKASKFISDDKKIVNNLDEQVKGAVRNQLKEGKYTLFEYLKLKLFLANSKLYVKLK